MISDAKEEIKASRWWTLSLCFALIVSAAAFLIALYSCS